MTITGAVYPEVAELLEALDPGAIAARKDREVRAVLRQGRLHRLPERDEWTFSSLDSRGKRVELVVDCRDLTFSSGRRTPNDHIRRSVVEAVQRIVGEAIDAEVAAALRGETA